MPGMTQCLWKNLFAVSVVLSVLVSTPSVIRASDKRPDISKQSEGMALIKRGVELTDMRSSGPYRIRLKVTVTDQAVGKRDGTDAVTFSSIERWRRELHVTGYDEVAVFLGHTIYRTRS